MSSGPVAAFSAEAAQAAEAVMECRICWHVYDPAEGDEVGQVAPDTPFSALPNDWRCPNCDAAKSMFLEIN